jgi:UDP-N-acetylmuramoyl-tripeptide--D-alanyl-D-alanine ligase
VTADITTYGMSPRAAFRAVEVETRGAEGSTFEIESTKVSLKVPGMHNVYNALAAITTAALLGVGPAGAAGPLLDFRPIRMKTVSIGEITAIDDTYNANPDSVGAALDTLVTYPAVRRIFVMGAMLELGAESARFHRQTGRKVAGSGIDILVGIGGDTSEAVAGAVEEGMPGDRANFFEAKTEAAAFLKQALRPGDVVLLKGSRATGLEEILVYLKQEMVEGRA